MATKDTPDFKVGERLRLKVREPRGRKNARAGYRGNYLPADYIGEVETASLGGMIPQIEVRWRLPASFGYDTAEGTVSTLVLIANGVWLEARKRPRNVVATIEKITEEEYQKLLSEAANQ